VDRRTPHALGFRAQHVMRPLLVLSVLLLLIPLAAAKKSRRRGPYGARSRVERPAEAKGEASLRVRSIDLGRRVVVVEVGGFPRAPAGNLFTFTDDRGRKFIATDATCEAPFPSGIRVCDLTTPVGYERHPWVGLELHLHGLSSRTVAAPKESLTRAFEDAIALGQLTEGDAGTPAPASADLGAVVVPSAPPATEEVQ
jgi:hypothetical protein